MYKIAVIGDRDSVLGYMALGFAARPVSSPDEAASALHALARTGDIGVIFITEDIACQIEEDIAKYKDKLTPAIVPIPGRQGSTGYGMANLKNAALRATGSNVLFD